VLNIGVRTRSGRLIQSGSEVTKRAHSCIAIVFEISSVWFCFSRWELLSISIDCERIKLDFGLFFLFFSD